MNEEDSKSLMNHKVMKSIVKLFEFLTEPIQSRAEEEEDQNRCPNLSVFIVNIQDYCSKTTAREVSLGASMNHLIQIYARHEITESKVR